METLEKLKKEKSTPCVSIIIPTHRVSPERTVDKLVVDKSISKAKKLLFSKYGNNGTKDLVSSMDEALKQIDFVHNSDGLGLYISPGITEMVRFPFPVTEKTVVGDSFEIRDLHYMSQYLHEYFVLAISLNMVKLYRGNGDQLQEITDERFPMEFHDDYEYARVSLGSSNGYSLKSTEKDQANILQERFITFLKSVDKNLSFYLTDKLPLILTGVKQELAYFDQITTHSDNIAGKVVGNLNHQFDKLSKRAFEKLQTYYNKENKKLINRLNEAIGQKLAVTGIKNVWQAAKEGKGLILLVEKDFSKPGFIGKEREDKLFLKPPVGEHEIITDAIELIIETVLDKNGQVIMVENGQLEDFEKIGLILRYA